MHLEQQVDADFFFWSIWQNCFFLVELWRIFVNLWHRNFSNRFYFFTLEKPGTFSNGLCPSANHRMSVRPVLNHPLKERKGSAVMLGSGWRSAQLESESLSREYSQELNRVISSDSNGRSVSRTSGNVLAAGVFFAHRGDRGVTLRRCATCFFTRVWGVYGQVNVQRLIVGWRSLWIRIKYFLVCWWRLERNKTKKNFKNYVMSTNQHIRH